jgi:putative endonuclease
MSKLPLAPHLVRGAASERHAKAWLTGRGLIHLESNYRCAPGELDLIMRDAACLVIVEVRYRRQQCFGGGLESVTRTKIARIALATRHFLQHRRQYADWPLRFDVLAISGVHPRIQFDWRKAAFEIDYN